MSAGIVNLNKSRKAKARAEKVRGAEQNRAKFGRTKFERARDEDEHKRRTALLDGAKLVPGADDAEDERSGKITDKDKP